MLLYHLSIGIVFAFNNKKQTFSPCDINSSITVYQAHGYHQMRANVAIFYPIKIYTTALKCYCRSAVFIDRKLHRCEKITLH